MEIHFFKCVSSLRCLETSKAHRDQVNGVQGLGIPWRSHVYV